MPFWGVSLISPFISSLSLQAISDLQLVQEIELHAQFAGHYLCGRLLDWLNVAAYIGSAEFECNKSRVWLIYHSSNKVR